MLQPGAYRGPPFDRVFFDCDSTLCTIEGLDALAERAGLLASLEPVTCAANNGDISFDTAYAERLALLQPDREAADWLAEQYRRHITPGAVTLIQGLQQAGKQVHIVSGGLLQALLPLAAPLGIPVSHIHGVSLLLNSDGSYGGYDQSSPLCRQHGKNVLCQQLTAIDERAVVVGDGITDLEAAGPRVDFIGFGGVARRMAVSRRAAAYYDRQDMAGLVTLLLGNAVTDRATDKL